LFSFDLIYYLCFSKLLTIKVNLMAKKSGRDFPLAPTPTGDTVLARRMSLPKAKPVPAPRLQQVVDSLNKVGYNKIAAGVSSRIASKETKADLLKGGSKDVDNATRYQGLIDEAKKKKTKGK
jgi:hypothetical protein